LVVGIGVRASGEADGRASPRVKQRAQLVTTPLRVHSTVSFAQKGVFAWLNPPRCDDSGNLYLTLVPTADAVHASGTTLEGQPKKPSDILRLSADGKKSTLYTPASAPEFADADEVSTFATALDPAGKLWALIWAPRGDGGSQYITSFDESGRVGARIKVEDEDVVVQLFEVFGSGEFLLRGARSQPPGVRLAVMASGGGAPRDVYSRPEESWNEKAAAPGVTSHMARGADGRVYFVAEAHDAIHVIEPSGESRRAFKLRAVPDNYRLVDLRAAGSRLAVVYFEGKPNEQGGRFWLATYEAALGTRVAVYGPAQGVPVCYQYSGSQDRFTVLMNERDMVTLAP
jgi:hypothetical protein